MSIIDQYRKSEFASLGALINKRNNIVNIEYAFEGFVLGKRKNIVFDFDLFLPTKGINLQRGNVWTLEQKQELIKSIILEKQTGYVTVIICVQENDRNLDNDRYEVIDGKQRLTAIMDFMQNKFAVNLNGNEYFYKDFDTAKSNEFLLDLSIKANTYYSYPKEEITDDQKIALFKMLNFAGTPQEKEHLEKLNSI